MNRVSVIAVASLLAVLAGCGFQLRGDVELPAAMATTYIDYRASDAELRRSLARALALSGASVVTRPENAGAVLRLHSAAVRRRVLAKDAAGRPREYEIEVTLRYDVLDPDGRQITPLQDVERRSNLLLDPSDPLKNAGDVAYVVQSLREDAIWEMLRRIAVSARSTAETE